MPPKKRKQTAPAQHAPSPAQETSTAETVTTPRGKTIETTAASSRNKRSIAMPPPEQPAAKKAKAGDRATAPKRGPGRPRKDGAVAPPQKTTAAPPAKRGPGRPPKNPAPSKAVATGGRKSARLSDVAAPDVKLPPLRRGGRSNAAGAAPAEQEEEEEEDADADEDEDEDAVPVVPRRGRGRPPKHAATVVAAPAEQEKDEGEEEEDAEDDEDEEAAPVAPRRGRGRPPKSVATVAPTPKRAERPRRQPHYHVQHLAVDEQLETELTDAAESPVAAAKYSRRNPGKSNKPAVADEEDGDVDVSNDANITEATTIRADFDFDHDEDDEDRNYWLMKAEPESRIETNANGEEVDVKFTIDDLRTRSEPEPWDGIRNLQAQKNLKTMKIGDLAFFYESNCKTPGVVGIMEVVREATPDVSAFSKDSAYYDPKSLPSKPKWMVVHVEFRRKFAKKITLKELQRFGQPGGALANMGVIKQSRLSVSRVSKPEWDFVMSLVEDDHVEEPAAIASEDRIDDDTADLGTDFAMAFEAPANLGGMNDSDTELAHTAEDSLAGPDAPTSEEPNSEVPAVETAGVGEGNTKPTDGRRLKSQTRSVSRGRSRKPVTAPPFWTSSSAHSTSKEATDELRADITSEQPTSEDTREDAAKVEE